MSARRRLFGLLLVAMVALAACTSDNGDNGDDGDDANGADAAEDTSTDSEAAAETQEEDGDFTYALVTHAAPGDAFWDVVQNGHNQAGEDLGVGVTYQGSGDPQEQAQLIDAAVSQQVDGLAVSMANPDALQSSIEAAVAADIPVITINSGVEQSEEFGAITHVGQTESIAGEGAGEELSDAGASHLVCVIHEAGNIGLEERCGGAADTFGGEVENLQVDINDLAAATSTITALLQSNESVDAVLTLNSSVAGAAVSAINEAGRTGEVEVATFDVDESVLESIEAGDMLFAVDQQPYLQGYLPVVMLHLFNTNGNTVGGGQPVLTGPGFITSENVGEVADYAAGGTR